LSIASNAAGSSIVSRLAPGLQHEENSAALLAMDLRSAALPIDIAPLQSHHLADAKTAVHGQRNRNPKWLDRMRDHLPQLIRVQDVLVDHPRLIALSVRQLLDSRGHVAHHEFVIERVAEDRDQNA
jgi:hypothetical protein